MLMKFSYFRDLKIRDSILIVFLTITCLYVLNILYNRSGLDAITQNVESIYSNRMLSINSLLEADRDGYQSRLEIAEAIVQLSDSGSYQIADLELRIAAMNENLVQIETRFETFREIYLSTGGENHEAFEVFDKHLAKVKTHSQSIQSSISSENLAQLKRTYFGSYIADFDTMRDAMDQLTGVSYEQTQREFEASVSKANEISRSGIFFFIGMLLILVIAGVALTKNIVGQLGCEPKEAAEIAKRLAGGDLSLHLSKNVEKGLYGDLNKMVEKLQEVIESVIKVASSVASASQGFSTVSQEVSLGANQQAASAEELSAAMEEMSASIELNTANAHETKSIGSEATEGINKGNVAATETVASMKSIVEKIRIIGDIVGQTNILALNAAVEASRAGEQGKGFSVIASEVRSLAEKSQIAADEIDELSQKSVAVAENSGDLLHDLVPKIEKTAELVNGIVASSAEQNESSNQVNNAIQELNQIIQQNAASAEEMASSSIELASQAENLKDLVSFFKLR